MARYCEHCGAEVPNGAKFCRSCGKALTQTGDNSPQPAVPAQPPAQYAAQGQPVFYKNPGVATVLSFLWAGAGQIYNGEIGKGIAFIVLYVFSVLLMFVLVGFLTTPILWIWGMIDANSSAKRINAELAQRMGNRSGL